MYKCTIFKIMAESNTNSKFTKAMQNKMCANQTQTKMNVLQHQFHKKALLSLGFLGFGIGSDEEHHSLSSVPVY